MEDAGAKRRLQDKREHNKEICFIENAEARYKRKKVKRTYQKYIIESL